MHLMFLFKLVPDARRGALMKILSPAAPLLAALLTGRGEGPQPPLRHKLVSRR